MQLQAGRVYTIREVANSPSKYRDWATSPSLRVSGGQINLFFSNTTTSSPTDPYGLEEGADVGNPFGIKNEDDSFSPESVTLTPRFDFLSFTVADGTPVVDITTGVYEEVKTYGNFTTFEDFVLYIGSL
jgi:hypothetical protein